MGRVTEFIYYINKELVTQDDVITFSHLTVTDKIKQARKAHRKLIKKENK